MKIKIFKVRNALHIDETEKQINDFMNDGLKKIIDVKPSFTNSADKTGKQIPTIIVTYEEENES